MIKVYDLCADKKHIKDVQHATLETDDFGLQSEHGLFGSQEWWTAVEKGVIPKVVIEGMISRVYMSGHNDFPEFEITTETGKSSWERLGDEKFYAVGRKCKIIYALQKFKKPLPMPGNKEEKFSKIVIELWIGASQ